LTNYAQSVSQGKKIALNTSSIQSQELRQLATALESMRTQLDGKAYIEEYIQTLTHELKSPLAGIHAAAELLQEPMSSEQRNKFVKNIDSETLRLRHLIERLLKLSKLEQQQQLENPQPILINDIANKLLETQSARVDLGNIRLEREINGELWCTGDRFLLEQCISNLLDNAFDFTPPNARLKLTIDAPKREISLFNEGPNIPEFALGRLSERFYSLSRPKTGLKSTGLGLSFVHEAMELHCAQLRIENMIDGVKATITFPSS
jgi:two-component system sensor histidine kinase CreC